MIQVQTLPHEMRKDLLRVLAEIDESATGDRAVVVDGNEAPPGIPSNWEVFLRPKPPGAWKTQNKFTYWDMMQIAVERNQDLVSFEDDIRLSKNAAGFMERFPVPKDCAMMMFYAPWGAPNMSGVLRIHSSRFNFAQCLKIPLETCKFLCERKQQAWSSRTGGSDENIRKLLEKEDRLVGIFYPGLIQHVGNYSVASNGALVGDRSSPAWAGEVFDPNESCHLKDYR